VRFLVVLLIVIIVVILVDTYPATRSYAIGAGITMAYLLGRSERDDTH
jgi:hypothetical protein